MADTALHVNYLTSGLISGQFDRERRIARTRSSVIQANVNTPGLLIGRACQINERTILYRTPLLNNDKWIVFRPQFKDNTGQENLLQFASCFACCENYEVPSENTLKFLVFVINRGSSLCNKCEMFRFFTEKRGKGWIQVQLNRFSDNDSHFFWLHRALTIHFWRISRYSF